MHANVYSHAWQVLFVQSKLGFWNALLTYVTYIDSNELTNSYINYEFI